MHNTIDVSCPVLVRSDTGESIARLNPDCTWSVKWDAVLDQAYRPMTKDNVALTAVCQVLLAARDNFLTSAWENQHDWVFPQFDIYAGAPTQAQAALVVLSPAAVVAYVNLNGVWSVNWDQVHDMRRLSRSTWGHVALVGFCELLNAAKDNFHTSPMQYRSGAR